MTLLQPPLERDLPPGRQAEMRAQLLEEISSAKAAGGGSRFVPLLAAAAVLLVVVSVALVIAARQERHPVVSRPDRGLPVPGYSSDELKRIQENCIKPWRGATGVDIDFDGLRLYNVASYHDFSVGLLYGPDGRIMCEWSQVRVPVSGNGGWDAGDPDWLAGAVSVDTLHSTGGNGRYVYTFGGRVVPGVTTVRLTAGSGTRSVDVVNGTWIGTIETTKASKPGDFPKISAYDADGTLVGTYDSKAGQCLVTPSGKKIAVGPGGAECTVARSWH